MPWYKTGTVSVVQNSNAVQGTSTAFIANARVGDAFRGPDGGWYEVTNIASDTALSISPTYQGATNASGIYALAPMQGYVKDSADALRALVNQFGGILGVLGNTPTQAGVRSSLNLTNTDGLPEGPNNLYYTATRAIGAALAGLSLADATPVVSTDSVLIAAGKLQAQATAALPKAGGTLTGPVNDAPAQSLLSAATVNIGASTSNVVAISGTTTITGFGTIAAGARRTLRFTSALVLTHNATSLILPTGANITTAANDTAEFLSLGSGNWICLRYSQASGKPVAFAYDRSNVVGTVSWSGSAPTGAIIESGSTANGQYTKFADGTMFCWLLITGLSIAMNSGYGGGIIGTQNWAYPVGFASTPVVFMGARAAGKFTTTSPADATSATLGSFLVFDPAGGVYTGSFNCFFFASGRWK
jgi:hypothetical protein